MLIRFGRAAASRLQAMIDPQPEAPFPLALRLLDR
jgi:hypothetical protein